jgi:hemoglobin
MRHAPFTVGVVQRDAWLKQMRTALDEIALPPEADTIFWNYVVMAASSLLNTD